MATQAEQRWISENQNLAQQQFGSLNPPDGTVAQFIQRWYQENPGSQPDATDAPILAEINAVVDPNRLNNLIAQADAGDAAAIAALNAAGYENVLDTENLPIEQGILQTALPNLLGDIEGDAARRELVATLTGQATQDYNAARDALSPEASAARLAQELAMADETTGRVSDSAATAAAQQLAALQSSVAAMQQNLTGDLAARAAALQQQIAAFTQNLNTFDATQRAALAEQITANQQNLEQSVAAQQQALATELQSLRGGVDTRTAAQRASLEQELTSLRDVNTAEANARKAALQSEIAGLRTASAAENQARVAALQAEIDALTAAQAPMAQARLDSANALTTAVNLGLQATNDKLTAQRAKQGYLGSSSFSDANLARAAIGARQDAAQVMGAAREANAGDLRTIQSRAATEGRSLADILAGRNLDISGREATEGRSLADLAASNEAAVGARGATGTRGITDAASQANFDITSRGATGTRTLADTLAEGTRTIGDTGAAGTAAITNATAASRQGIGNAGATQSYQDQTMGSTQLRALLDSLAQGQGTIATTRATQQQQARDAGSASRQNYFDNAYTRSLGGTLSRPTLGANLASTLTSLGNYGNSGLDRSLNALNWWSTNTAAAPTPGANAAPVDTSGNAISSLGAGLLGSAINLGNSQNWWQTPKTTTPVAAASNTSNWDAAVGNADSYLEY